MPRLFVGNFDFEYDLAAPGSAAGGGANVARAVSGALAPAWVAIAEKGDFILTPQSVAAGEPVELVALGAPLPAFVTSVDEVPDGPEIELVPWGWTAALVALAEKRGWCCAAPPVEAVREVNRRTFRLALESEWNVGLPGTIVARSLSELNEFIARHAGDRPGWILKSEFGMAGRESVRGRGGTLSDVQVNWARKRLAAGLAIICEQRVEPVAEAGVQIEIPPHGEPQFVGVSELIVDTSGVYRGSRIGGEPNKLAIWQPAVEVALRAARRAQERGYFGPLGVDAMLYRDADSALRLRPLQDLNARYTMGRLALGFRRWMSGPESRDRSVDRLAQAGDRVPSDVARDSPPPPQPSPHERGRENRDERLAAALRPPFGTSRFTSATWLHFGAAHLSGRAAADWRDGVRQTLEAEVELVFTSPRMIDGQPPVHHSVLVLAPDAAARGRAERAVFDSLGIKLACPPSESLG